MLTEDQRSLYNEGDDNDDEYRPFNDRWDYVGSSYPHDPGVKTCSWCSCLEEDCECTTDGPKEDELAVAFSSAAPRMLAALGEVRPMEKFVSHLINGGDPAHWRDGN